MEQFRDPKITIQFWRFRSTKNPAACAPEGEHNEICSRFFFHAAAVSLWLLYRPLNTQQSNEFDAIESIYTEIDGV